MQSTERSRSRRYSFKNSLSNLTDRFRFAKFKSSDSKPVPQSLSHESSLSHTSIPVTFEIAKTRCVTVNDNEQLYSILACTKSQPDQVKPPNHTDPPPSRTQTPNRCIILNNARSTVSPRLAPTLFPHQARPHEVIVATSRSSSLSSDLSLSPASSVSSRAVSTMPKNTVTGSLKEHFCFYCSQYCSRLALCQCPSCILVEKTNNKKISCFPKPSSSHWRHSSPLKPVAKRAVDLPTDTLRLRLQPRRLQLVQQADFEFKPICEPGEALPLYEEIHDKNIQKDKTFDLSRSNSNVQCSLQCLASPFTRVSRPSYDAYQKTAPSSKSVRRQRNLTASLTSPFAAPPQLFSAPVLDTNARDAQLDRFLDSLEDINAYLDKKLVRQSQEYSSAARLMKPAEVQNKKSEKELKLANKRARRNLTQPILFTNDLCHMNAYNNKLTVDDSINTSKSYLSDQLKQHQTLPMESSSLSLQPVVNSLANLQTPTPTSNSNKTFVSLSDILQGSKNQSPTRGSPPPTLDPNTKSNNSLGASLRDLLSVQALFKELELDCDEQIKLLDETEQKQKQANIKQSDILNELRKHWQQCPESCRFKPRGPSKKNVRQARRSHLKRKNRLVISHRVPKPRVKLFIFCSHVDGMRMVCSTIKCHKNIDLNSKKQLYCILTTHNRYTNSSTKPKILFHLIQSEEENHRYSVQFFYAGAVSKDFYQQCLASFNKFCRSGRPRPEINASLDSLSNCPNLSETNSTVACTQSLLDKYYDKYCKEQNLPSTPPVMRRVNRQNRLERLDRRLQQQHIKRQTNLMIENYEMRNNDFNELIDACKWLTDAGFSDAVAGALSKSENTYPDIQQRLDMTRKDQTNSGLEELQECEQSAIQRRLQVLSNASAFFNVDFNYFKETFLNLNEDNIIDSEDDLVDDTAAANGSAPVMPPSLNNQQVSNTTSKLSKRLQFSNLIDQTPSKKANQTIGRFSSFRLQPRLSQKPNITKWNSSLDMTIPLKTNNTYSSATLDHNNNDRIRNRHTNASVTSSSSDSSSFMTTDAPPLSFVKATVSSLRQSLRRGKTQQRPSSLSAEPDTSLEDQLPKISLAGYGDEEQLQLTESLPVIDIELNVIRTSAESEVVPRRERCDSGVGGSLTREPIGRRREKWTSFRISHRQAEMASPELIISSLSVKQYAKLKKFALVRITALLEKYSQQTSPVKSGWDKFKPKFLRRQTTKIFEHQSSLYKDKVVFGVPLKLNVQRHGRPLPQPILQLMKYVRTHAPSTIGIFRKSGSKLRMAQLRETVERQPTAHFSDFEKLLNLTYYSGSPSPPPTELTSLGSGFSSQSDLDSSDAAKESRESRERSVQHVDTVAVDVADVLKQYFRELPECLCTDKLSQTLVDIFTYLPESVRLEAVQYCMLLLDDENRDVLQCLLYFLHDIAQHSDSHKMDSRNIAICLAPTLLNMSNLKETSPSQSACHLGVTSPTSHQTPPINLLTSLSSQLMSRQCNASLDCMSFLIEQPRQVFRVPSEAYTKCQFTRTDRAVPMSLYEHLGACSSNLLNIYFHDRIARMNKELRDKPRSWSRLRTDQINEREPNVHISYKTPDDEDAPLRLWKLSVTLAATPNAVLNKLLRGRDQWDDDLLESRVIEGLEPQTEIVQYVAHVMAPQPSRDFVELRGWRRAEDSGSKYLYAVYSSSIEHEKALKLGDIRANCLVNFYLVEEGSEVGTCKLYQIYRADYRGYSTEWYNRVQGHMLKRHLVNLSECLRSTK